jgi:hypothetical protein
LAQKFSNFIYAQRISQLEGTLIFQLNNFTRPITTQRNIRDDFRLVNFVGKARKSCSVSSSTSRLAEHELFGCGARTLLFMLEIDALG